jgi:lysophospholipase L1-like esterase
MRRARLPLVAVLAVIAAALAASLVLPDGGGAQGPPAPVTLRLSAAEGFVGAQLTGPPGATVTVAEQDEASLTPVATVTLADGLGAVAQLVPWRCDRTLRRFVATLASASDGAGTATAAIRTPSCARRLALATAPRRPRSGGSLTAGLTDTWGTGGVRATVCAEPPRGRSRCRTMLIAAGRASAGVAFPLRSAGLWHVSVRTPLGQRTRRAVRVARPRPLRLLATGDSMIQIVDSDLAARLKRGTVISDARISTGISKPFMLDWVAHARRQASARRPDATVVFLGANDGFPIGDAACCGAAWVDAYARRVRSMMDAYRRGGAARVYWMLLPTPGRASFASVFRAVNAAIRQAARRTGPGVTLIDVGRVVAPGGRFRRSISYRGRSVTVRQDDQVHLSTAGAAIAADLIVRELRRDGLTG